MRNSLIFLFLASAAMPAIAADKDSDREARREARAEARAEHHANRSQPAEPSAAPEQVRSVEPRHVDAPQVHQPQVYQQQVHQQQVQEIHPQVLERRSGRNFGSATQPTIQQQDGATDRVREWRGRERRVGNGPAVIETPNGTVGNGTLGNGSFREPRREPTGRDAIGNRRGPVVGSIPRPGAQPPLPTSTRQSRNRLSSVTAQHWRNNWRSNHRYDWRNHRNRHRSIFHLGFYYDPFGWNYRHYSIGSRLWPNYYQSSFWLNDPWQYRLPYAPPGYRWIRYFDDAILVDTWDGQVVDVIYNFFW